MPVYAGLSIFRKPEIITVDYFFDKDPNVLTIMHILRETNYGVVEHSIGVAEIVYSIILNMGYNDMNRFAYWFYLAGLGHDIGKSTWPPELHYKFPLSDDDWAINYQHPVRSRSIITDLCPEMPGFLLQSIEQHHEKPGGKGTPNGVQEMDWTVHVLAVADQFNAMTSVRPYRHEPYPPQLAISEISRWGALPSVVAALVKTVKATPFTVEAVFSKAIGK